MYMILCALQGTVPRKCFGNTSRPNLTIRSANSATRPSSKDSDFVVPEESNLSGNNMGIAPAAYRERDLAFPAGIIWE